MTDAQLRQSARERCLWLCDAGPGVHPYAIDQAERLVKAEPHIHAGLVAAVGEHIGPAACVVANRALSWFRGAGSVKQ